MGNRCNDCQKFVGLENGDPEVDGEDLTEGTVTIEVRLTRNCAECSGELKEYTFPLEADHSDEIKAHEEEHHDGDPQEYTLEVDSTEADESGGGRYKKNMISVTAHYTITCDECKAEVVADAEVSDEAPASSFDEMY